MSSDEETFDLLPKDLLEEDPNPRQNFLKKLQYYLGELRPKTSEAQRPYLAVLERYAIKARRELETFNDDITIITLTGNVYHHVELFKLIFEKLFDSERQRENLYKTALQAAGNLRNVKLMDEVLQRAKRDPLHKKQILDIEKLYQAQRRNIYLTEQMQSVTFMSPPQPRPTQSPQVLFPPSRNYRKKITPPQITPLHNIHQRK